MRYQKGHTPWNKGLHITFEQSQCISEGVLKFYAEHPELKEKLSRIHSERYKRGQITTLKTFRKGYIPWNKSLTKEMDDRVARIAEKLTHHKIPDSVKAKLRITGKEVNNRPEVKARIREANLGRVAWNKGLTVETDLRVRRNIEKSRASGRFGIPIKVKPNKLEARLENIFNKYLPEYNYNGDGRLGVVLAGLIPDFVNVNGKKEVIEVFGDYWHKNEGLRWHQTELGRMMAYNSVGFKCLILWEHELNSLSDNEIVKRVKTAFRQKAK